MNTRERQNQPRCQYPASTSPPVYVIGHKSPDTDTICAAIGYAELLRAQGEPHVIPARQGKLRPETQWLLERFQVPVPVFVEDVYPRVRDAMTTPPIVARPEQSLGEVGWLFKEHNIRAVPVVDEDCHLQGLVSVEDFARLFLDGLDPSLDDTTPLDLDNIVDVLGGEVLVRATRRRLRDKVMVGAMHVSSMVKRLEPDILLVLGDREEAQVAAIETGVGALIITGDLPVSERVLNLARERDVTIISTHHHTMAVVRLLRMSISVSHIMRTEITTCAPDDRLDEVRALLARWRTLPVVDEAGRVVGVLSRSDLLSPVRHRVVLVDHNERSQTVAGLEEAEIIGIIDHHRIADIQTVLPVFFRNEPVGATSTIVAGMYREAGVDVPPSIAGILLGAILSDTVLFRSPTSTSRDEATARWLAEIAGVEVEPFGEELFAAATSLTDMAPRDILTADLKTFRLDDSTYAVSYLETVNRAEVERLREALLEEMERMRREQGFATVLLMVVDIPHNETEILIAGQEKAVAAAFGRELATPHSIVLPGIMSRKKQVVPVLPRITDHGFH